MLHDLLEHGIKSTTLFNMALRSSCNLSNNTRRNQSHDLHPDSPNHRPDPLRLDLHLDWVRAQERVRCWLPLRAGSGREITWAQAGRGFLDWV